MDKSEIIPIDWIDFGILLRWYDVGNLLSIAFIIRTGSSFRHLVETNEDSSEHFRRIETNINYINEIFKSL